jgi:hypothetical protein
MNGSQLITYPYSRPISSFVLRLMDCILVFICLLAMRMPVATCQNIIRPSTYNRSIRELGVSHLVTYQRDVPNEVSCFMRTSDASRQVAPPSAFPRTRCNWREADVAFYYIYTHILCINRDKVDLFVVYLTTVSVSWTVLHSVEWWRD